MNNWWASQCDSSEQSDLFILSLSQIKPKKEWWIPRLISSEQQLFKSLITLSQNKEIQQFPEKERWKWCVVCGGNNGEAYPWVYFQHNYAIHQKCLDPLKANQSIKSKKIRQQAIEKLWKSC
jgi:hypothetical protein